MADFYNFDKFYDTVDSIDMNKNDMNIIILIHNNVKID